MISPVAKVSRLEINKANPIAGKLANNTNAESKSFNS
jgi:hypothetical protein